MKDEIKVMIVDDDKFICSSLSSILEVNEDIKVIATAYSGVDAISTYKTALPHILLMDIRMGDINGIQAGEEILSLYPHAKIIFLTTFFDDEYIVKALNMGAKGYLIKQDTSSIVPAIRAAASGQNVFGNEIVGKIVNMGNIKNSPKNLDPDILSSREMEIVAQVAKGLNNKEISDCLHLSEGTVRNYISTILEKLELRDRTQLAIYYYKKPGV